MKRIAIAAVVLVAVLFLVLPLAALAGTANLSWTGPTQYTDNTPIPAGTGVSYRVYGGAQGAAKSVLATVSATTYTHSTAPNGVTYCYQVTAVIAGVESAPSTEGCRPFPDLTPKAPTGLTVTVINTTAYRMRQSVDGFEMVALGTVPLGTACNDKAVDGYNVVPRAAVKLTNQFDTLPLVVFARCSVG